MIRTRQAGFSFLRLFGWLLGIPAFLVVCGALGATLIVVLANDRLPPISGMLDYRPKMPLQIYTVDN
ncbi:MAG: hypothetical protein WBD51_10870, partial [Burkholderiaceae bacterium]